MFAKWAVQCCGLVAVLAVTSVAGAQSLMAVSWDDQAVHYLDDEWNDVSGFQVPSQRPQGVTTDGTLIWTGHHLTTEIIAFNYSGDEQFRFLTVGYLNLTSVEYINDRELAFSNSDEIIFCDPFDGHIARTIPSQGVDVEDLAWDGEYLWQLGTQYIYASSVHDGAVAQTFDNPAIGDLYGGTALAIRGDTLFVGSATGNWWEVSKVDGTVLDSGNNGIDMFGLTTFVPEPASLILLGVAGLFARRG
ncbi:MAG: PEP-CTERM sorting domain-containing protein [Phycisphaerae bacterium]|jgi:hypothetical protein